MFPAAHCDTSHPKKGSFKEALKSTNGTLQAKVGNGPNRDGSRQDPFREFVLEARSAP